MNRRGCCDCRPSSGPTFRAFFFEPMTVLEDEGVGTAAKIQRLLLRRYHPKERASGICGVSGWEGGGAIYSDGTAVTSLNYNVRLDDFQTSSRPYSSPVVSEMFRRLTSIKNAII